MKKKSIIKIGKNIKLIRRSHGYTQEELAEEIEVSTRHVSDIEQDKTKPSYEVLTRICNFFKIGLDEIFKEYLEIGSENKINYSLTGFDKLSTKDKNTIEHLIMYFNKENKTDI